MFARVKRLVRRLFGRCLFRVGSESRTRPTKEQLREAHRLLQNLRSDLEYVRNAVRRSRGSDRPPGTVRGPVESKP
jgi:hypothetical protein